MSGGTDNASIYVRSLSQFQSQATFGAWNFTAGTGVWMMDGMPHLQWEP